MLKSQMKKGVKVMSYHDKVYSLKATFIIPDNDLENNRLDNVIGEIVQIHDDEWKGWCNVRYLSGDGCWKLALYHADELEFISNEYDSGYSDAVVKWLSAC